MSKEIECTHFYYNFLGEPVMCSKPKRVNMNGFWVDNFRGVPVIVKPNNLFRVSKVHIVKDYNEYIGVEVEKLKAALDPLYLMRDLRNKHGYFGGHDNGQVIDREIEKYESLLKQIG
jgi:hypothetical protein